MTNIVSGIETTHISQKYGDMWIGPSFESPPKWKKGVLNMV
jgi:hypothetical protein